MADGKLLEKRTEYRSRDFVNPDPDPFLQFQTWYREAEESDLLEPNACALATTGKSLIPSVRMVLLKGYDTHGFMFFTNYGSRKGRELTENPNAALLFYWDVLERQIRIVGSVEKVTRGESEEYFRKRPRGAQLSALISKQSERLNSRPELEKHWKEAEALYADKEIPFPDTWGGFRLVPHEFEFWQGQENRLHRRYRYLRAGTQWQLEEISP